MGVQFGVCNCDGKPLDNDVIERAEALLAPYAPDGISVFRRESFALLYGSFETGFIPKQPPQPYRLPNRSWMMWDGRLDNRRDLRRASTGLDTLLTDVEVVGSTYDRCGTEMFSQLIGDWAVSIFSEARREVVLARDFIGARPLFYRADGHQLAWSTVLDPLVLLKTGAPRLSEPYLAGWISSFPRSHLTPYEDIWSVPPSSIVRIRAADRIIHRYWDFEPGPTIRYRDDREYEEQFHAIFREAVRRRMDSSKPILAELSGGMDSSSIVCVADSLHAARDCHTPHLDTVTYFDAQEPNWDELPYAEIVERKRGRVGSHIDVGPESFDRQGPIRTRFRMIPASSYARSAAADSFSQLLSNGGYRVVLSGLGGDEFLGGVPTPVPELADLLVGLEADRFLRQSFRWALAKRKPILTLWSSVVRQFLPRSSVLSRQSIRQLNWLTDEFVARHQHELSFPSRRTKLTGAPPSFQANLAAIETLRSQLSCMTIESNPTYEWRYPFLDRDLVFFCISIPREQMVRPQERRSLMRRALAATVPREILNRRRKAYVSRSLVRIIGAEYARLRGCQPLLIEELGIVKSQKLEQAVRNAEQGWDVAALPLLRTLALEDWLRDLRDHQTRSGNGLFPKPYAIRVVHCSDQQLLGPRKLEKKGGDTHELHEARNHEARGGNDCHLLRGLVD